MRAKTVFKKAYIFDFDETLVTTDAKIHILRNGVVVKSLDSKQFNKYVKDPRDKYDFTEFRDGELILKAKKYKMWPVIKSISDAIRAERTTSDIYILTARGAACKPFIYEFLKKNGIQIEIAHIIALGDDAGKTNISEEKRKSLSELKKEYDKVFFFDDDPKNIQLAITIPGISTRLVEEIEI